MAWIVEGKKIPGRSRCMRFRSRSSKQHERRHSMKGTVAYLGVAVLIASYGLRAATLPEPAVDEPRSDHKSETVVLAGGCFWGVEAVFDAVKGVSSAVAGYSGGSKANAEYEIVSTGTTGHAESVQVTFDPSQISFGQIARNLFFGGARSDGTEPPGSRRRALSIARKFFTAARSRSKSPRRTSSNWTPPRYSMAAS